MFKKASRGTNLGTGIRAHFLGATHSVTGSFHYFEYEYRGKVTRFALDAGMLQEDESENFRRRLPKGTKASDLDFVIFSHAHIDHIGYFPKLWKDGFRGKAFATAATRDLMHLLLPDSGKIQEIHAEEAAQSKEPNKAQTGALYTRQDAVDSLKLVNGIPFNQRFSPSKNVTVEFLPSSHLLGAAVVVVEIGRAKDKRTIVFSGDIGPRGMSCLKDIAAVKKADYVICESTYGNKLHPKVDCLKVLANAVNAAYERACNHNSEFGFGKIFVPSFACGRLQTMLYHFRAAMALGMIPSHLAIFVDSPMAIKATEIYRQHASDFRESDRLLAEQIDLFTTPRYADCMKQKDSIRLDEAASEPIVILSSSGMANGGRMLGHLKHGLKNPNSSVMFCGHQSEGTNGALLTAGEAKTIRIDDEEIPVRAHIELLEAYSGHGDADDIMDWLSKFESKPIKIFLVHGEEEPRKALKQLIEQELGWDVVAPNNRDCFTLA